MVPLNALPALPVKVTGKNLIFEMPRRGIFGNLSKMSRRQFLCRGQPPERLELNFRCPRIVTVLMRRPPHLAPTLVICFPSEHRSTAHGENAEIWRSEGILSERFLSLHARALVNEASEDAKNEGSGLHFK